MNGRNNSEEIDVQPRHQDDGWKTSEAKLQELICNERELIDCLLKMLQESSFFIEKRSFKKALSILKDVERLSEYGTNCGKSLPKSLIITTLNNEAYCFYALGKLQEASKYIQTINCNIQFQISTYKEFPSHVFDPILAQSLKFSEQSFRSLVQSKLNLAKYQMQYSYLQSQLGHIEIAIDSVKKAIKLYKEVFARFNQHPQQKVIQFKSNYEGDPQYSLQTALKKLEKIQVEVKVWNEKRYLKLARFAVYQWSKKLSMKLSEKQKGYNLKNIAFIEQLYYNKYEPQNIFQQPFIQKLLLQVCHLSMAYFQLSRQYSVEHSKQSGVKKTKKGNTHKKMAKIYHMFSLIIIGLYFPYQCRFMEQSVKVFEEAYKTPLRYNGSYGIEIDSKVDPDLILQGFQPQQSSRLNHIEESAKTHKVRTKSFDALQNIANKEIPQIEKKMEQGNEYCLSSHCLNPMNATGEKRSKKCKEKSTIKYIRSQRILQKTEKLNAEYYQKNKPVQHKQKRTSSRLRSISVKTNQQIKLPKGLPQKKKNRTKSQTTLNSKHSSKLSRCRKEGKKNSEKPNEKTSAYMFPKGKYVAINNYYI